MLGYESVTKQDPMGPSRKRAHHVLHLPPISRKTLASQAFLEFQRIHLTRGVRKCRKKGNHSNKIK